MTYERINWENLPSTATPRGATNLNRMDVGIADAHAGLFDDADIIYDPEPFALVADCFYFVDGTQTQALMMPPDPVQGNRVAIYITGTTGEITLDGNGADVGKQGDSALTLVGPGVEKLTRTLWQYIGYWETWVLLAAGVTPTADFIEGAGTTGAEVLRAETPAGARSALGITRENPVIVTEAHDATVGEFIICATGGYAITIPEEAEHGDTITIVTDAQATGSDVTVEWFDIQQDTHDSTLTNTGQQLTLRYIKDADLGGGPISGWYATTVDFVWNPSSP